MYQEIYHVFSSDRPYSLVICPYSYTLTNVSQFAWPYNTHAFY